MIPLVSSLGQGRTAPAERDVTVGRHRAWAGEMPPAIFCHGSGASLPSLWSMPWQRATIQRMAARCLTTVPDLGLETWGNDTGRARIESARAYLGTLGASGPVTLMATSMGALNAFGYALTKPQNVRAIAAIIPAVSLNDLWANRGGAAAINAAYPPAYNPTTHGPAYSPLEYASSIDPDIPIHLFISSNDTLCLPEFAHAFVEARPQTILTDLGAVGHGDPSFAPMITAGLADEWLKTL